MFDDEVTKHINRIVDEASFCNGDPDIGDWVEEIYLLVEYVKENENV